VSTINGYTENPYASVSDAVENNSNIWNKVDFLLYCKLPTNFFEYTPYRGLDGVGPFTNDTSVGHPHGWTNSYTLSGGNDFPDGRSAWYTTDYGWDGIRCVVTNLSKRQVRVLGAYWNQSYGFSALYARSTNSFAEARSRAESGLTNYTSVGFNWFAGKSYYSEYQQYYASISMPTMSYSLQLPTNGPEPIATGIFRTWPIITEQSGYSGRVFGYDGTQLGYNNRGSWTNELGFDTVWGWQSETNVINSGNFNMVWSIGGTNQIPEAPSADPASGNSVNKGVGLRYSDAFVDYQSAMMILDYSGENGFKYK
jgi:hypothetical protein